MGSVQGQGSGSTNRFDEADSGRDMRCTIFRIKTGLFDSARETSHRRIQMAKNSPGQARGDLSVSGNLAHQVAQSVAERQKTAVARRGKDSGQPRKRRLAIQTMERGKLSRQCLAATIQRRDSHPNRLLLILSLFHLL